MSEKDIIDEFVNSSNFEIIDNYISKPYEETIEELDKEIERLKEELQKLNAELRRYKSIVYLCDKVKDCDKA